MSRLIRIIGVGVLAALGSLTLSADEDLSRPQWWPSPWGAEDQLGAANRLGPDKVLQAAKLITEGAVFDMAFSLAAAAAAIPSSTSFRSVSSASVPWLSWRART